MKFSPTKLFYPLFFFLFLFSFFLIDGEYRFYLFASWSLFLLIFSFLTKGTSIHSSNAAKFALFLSMLFVISTIFSTHLPLSLEKLMFYLVALGIFIFFIRIPKNRLNRVVFFSYLAVVSLILNIIVLFFTFYVPDRSIFPGMNLLVRSFGHNHYAAYLLLVVPVFWWQLLFAKEGALFSKKESKYLAILLLISSYILIIFSLARLALFISALQMILIFLINKKVFFSSLQSDLIRVMTKAFIFSFLSISLVFLFLSLPFKQIVGGDSDLCPLLLKRKELCKPLAENIRFMYWQKAIYILESNPIFGSGLKTFNYASRQFVMENYQVTSYAHNIFLHNLAETGLLAGGFFIFFIFYLFHQSLKVVKNSSSHLNQFLWLASFSSLLNATMDFDWHFFVIFVLTLIFLALILQKDFVAKSAPAPLPNRTSFFNKYLFFLSIAACSLALAYFLAMIFFKNNYQNLVVSYFPFFNTPVEDGRSKKSLNNDDFNKLHWWYKNDPNFIYDFATASNTPLEKRVDLQIELSHLDPTLFVKNVYFGNLNYLQANLLSNRFMETLQKYDFINNDHFLDYWRQINLAKQFFAFADQAYLAKNNEMAADYYQKAILLNPYVMGDIKAIFLSPTNDSSDLMQSTSLLKSFKDFNPEAMDGHFYDYMGFYNQVLISLFRENRLEEFYFLAEAMFKQQYNFSWFLFRDLVKISKTKEEKQRLNQVHDHFQDMTTWYDFLPALENSK